MFNEDDTIVPLPLIRTEPKCEKLRSVPIDFIASLRKQIIWLVPERGPKYGT